MKNIYIKFLILLLASCVKHAESLRNVGKVPPMSNIEVFTENNNSNSKFDTIQRSSNIKKTNSLWRQGATSFSHDTRAWKIGDIIKIKVLVQDSAKLNNSTAQNRNSSTKGGVSNMFGFDIAEKLKIPQAATNLINGSGNHKYNGSGDIDRKEQINTEIAAMVTQVLGNGNLVINGSQEVRVNNELREIKIAGIIASRDIGANNVIKSEQIAEARISYGGRGIVTDMQQPRIGSQIVDLISPF